MGTPGSGAETGALLAVALPTGRLFRDATGLFAALGAAEVMTLRESRRLTCVDRTHGLRFLAVKPVDIPIYVEHGAADMGVVGKDLILEQGRDVYEPLDLGIGACRLVVAEPATLRGRSEPRAWSCLRVATKYPRLAERHFSRQGIQVEIVPLAGSVELAPAMGLADRIVDLVASGRTLRENGLVEVEEILRSSARLIVNRASLKTRYQAIQRVIEGLRGRTVAAAGEAR
jgi:ATP phosphoribosyltransferase